MNRSVIFNADIHCEPGTSISTAVHIIVYDPQYTHDNEAFVSSTSSRLD